MKDGTQIYYTNWGSGLPVLVSHGWPLSADAWDRQMTFLASHGYRCIAHDRRGHGRSYECCSPAQRNGRLDWEVALRAYPKTWYHGKQCLYTWRTYGNETTNRR